MLRQVRLKRSINGTLHILTKVVNSLWKKFMEKKITRRDIATEIKTQFTSAKNKCQIIPIKKKIRYLLEQEHRTKIQSNVYLA
jgi:hypothetical protein